MYKHYFFKIFFSYFLHSAKRPGRKTNFIGQKISFWKETHLKRMFSRSKISQTETYFQLGLWIFEGKVIGKMPFIFRRERILENLYIL